MLWFHGSMLCNWSSWLYIGETGWRNCQLWWGNTGKTRHQRLFEVEGCLLWKNGILYSPPLHTLYIFSQHQKSKGGALTATVSLERFVKLRGEVFPSLTQQPIWKSSEENGPRYKIPEVCHAVHNLNLPSLISLEENWVEDEIVSMCVARKGKRKMHVRIWAVHYCVCVTATPCAVPLDTIFHRVIGLSGAIFLDVFKHFPTLRHCHLNL